MKVRDTESGLNTPVSNQTPSYTYNDKYYEKAQAKQALMKQYKKTKMVTRVENSSSLSYCRFFIDLLLKLFRLRAEPRA